MVGYKKDETLTPDQKLVASVVSGMVTRSLTNPLDVVKVRAQLQRKAVHNPKAKWFKITRLIIAETGIKSLWRGHNVGQIHSIIAVSSQFYFYEVSTRFIALRYVDVSNTALLHFSCGVFAGCMSAIAISPLDVLKVRAMIYRKKDRGLIKNAKRVYKSGGIFAFYEGLSAALVQIGPQVGISFAVFGFVQGLMLNLLSKHHGDPKMCPNQECDKPGAVAVASGAAGVSAGLVSKTLTYPFELAKKRLQIKSHEEKDDMFKCTSLTKCMLKTYEEEGVKGLFRGYKISVYKAQLSGFLAFTTYELICYATKQTLAVSPVLSSPPEKSTAPEKSNPPEKPSS